LSEAPTGGSGEAASIRLQFFCQSDVVGGLGDDGYVFEVFGGGADHGWAADVDVFDEMAEADVRLSRRLLEGVEVDDNHIDGQNAVLGYRGFVLGFAANVEQAAVDAGVEGLNPAIEHFGEAGQFADVLDLQAGFAEGAGGAAGGDELDAEAGEHLGEGDEAGFIGDAEEGAADGLEAVTCGGFGTCWQGYWPFGGRFVRLLESSAPFAGGNSCGQDTLQGSTFGGALRKE